MRLVCRSVEDVSLLNDVGRLAAFMAHQKKECGCHDE
jgi:hypothetical protein